MVNPSDAVLKGNVGFFWPQVMSNDVNLTLEARMQGYIRQTPDSFIEIKALDENPLGGGLGLTQGPSPVAVIGAAEQTGVLIPEILGTGRTAHFGGFKASTSTFRSRSLITNVDLSTVKSSKIVSSSLTFPEGLAFAGIAALEERYISDPTTNLVSEAQFTFKSGSKPIAAGKHEAFNLTLAPDWTTTGPATRRTLESGLTLQASVLRARPFSDFRPHLLGIQDLINLAYDRFVPAKTGRARLHGSQEGDSLPYLWMQECMVASPHTTSESTRHEAFPLFFLDDLGGPAALSRWLQIKKNFRTLRLRYRQVTATEGGVSRLGFWR